MIIVNFIGNEVEKYIRGLDQYDRGQILCISGLDLPKFVEVQFSLQETGGLAERIVGITTDGVTEVEIPNYMLTNNDATSDYEIYAFVYVTNETSAETVYKITMEVNSRPKPNPYDTPEDIGMFNRVIEVMKDSVTAAENAAGTSEKNAQKTGEDRKAIEEMVGTITGIEQQVQDVKEYAGQAKTAAENALLSEQEAKKSEEASLQHRTGAETAENNAEVAEQNAKKSEQAVEQAKQLVMQMGQEVLQNKNHVDGKVEAFNKVATDASDAIGTAKTDAVGAVETAGTEQTKKVSDEGAKQVKEVQDKGAEVLQSIPEDFTTQMQSKLDKNQGTEYAGKALVVGEDGNVTVGEVTGGDGIPIINTMSGESPLVVPDSAERVNKGFSLIGKSEQVTTTGANLIPFPYTDKDMSKNGVTFEVQQDRGVKIYGTATEAVDFFLSMLDYGNDSIFNNGKGNGKILSGGKNGVEIEYHGTNKRLYLTIAKGKTVNTVIYPQLQNGSTATPYEPYTEGKPSPSPEYPQEIKNVGKRNPETQKYEVNIKVTNAKESWDKEQTLTLTSDRPITKWDKLVEQDGQIGWLYQSKEIILNGSETEEWRKTGINDVYQLYMFDGTYKDYEVFCDKLVNYKASVNHITENSIFANTNYLYVRISGITDIQTLRDFLNSNNLKVVYYSKTQEFIPLPQDEQNAIRALKTYYPTTVITVDGGEVNPDIEVSYIADTKNYIDQKIAAIGKTVVETQKALL